jgi:hypothetical protein
MVSGPSPEVSPARGHAAHGMKRSDRGQPPSSATHVPAGRLLGRRPPKGFVLGRCQVDELEAVADLERRRSGASERCGTAPSQVCGSLACSISAKAPRGGGAAQRHDRRRQSAGQAVASLRSAGTVNALLAETQERRRLEADCLSWRLDRLGGDVRHSRRMDMGSAHEPTAGAAAGDVARAADSARARL